MAQEQRGESGLYRCPHHGRIDGHHYSKEREWGPEDGCPLLCADEEQCGEEVEPIASQPSQVGQGFSEADVREILDRAIACIEDWGSYASDYFRDKWDVDGDVKWFADKRDALRKLAASPEADETPQWSEVPPTGPGTMGRRPSGLLEKLEEEVERLREHARLEEQTAFAQQAHGNEIQWGRHTSLSTAHHTQANRLQALINSEGSSS